MGFGPNRVRSLPDGVGQILDEYLQNRAERLVSQPETPADSHNPGAPVNPGNGKSVHFESGMGAVVASQRLLRFGDLCPECGEAAVINEEGCRKCYACGYSEC